MTTTLQRSILILAGVVTTAFVALADTHKTFADSEDASHPQVKANELVMPLEQIPPTYVVPPTGYVPPAPTPSSKEGRALYQSMNCASCHSIVGQGGNLGPPLDGVAGRRSEEYLTAHLTDPAEHAKRFPHLHMGILMPHSHATTDEVKALVSYLMTLPEPQGGFLIQAHPPVSKPRKATSESRPGSSTSNNEGRQLFLDKGCAACHSVGGSGSSFGPKLDGVGKRLGRLLIEVKITARGKLGAGMQWRGVDDEDARKITDYLLSLPSP